MDLEFFKWLIAQGIGVALAGLIFFFYRKDAQQYADLWKTTSDQLIQVVKENTRAITENTTVVESLHSHIDLTDRRREPR